MKLPATFRDLRGPVVLARLAICSAAVLLAAWAELGGLARPADEWLRDAFIRLHASPAPETRILMVDIDEATLGRHPWPWPRARMADLIENVLQAGARGVALDITFKEPADPEGDARLAALAGHAPLVLAQLLDFAPGPDPLRGGVLVGGEPAPAGSGKLASGFLANHAGLAHAQYAGNITIEPDRDGILRRVPMYSWFQGRRYPTLTLALLGCCAAPVPQVPDVMRVPLARTPEAYANVSAGDVLDGRLSQAQAAGKLVLIGSSALSIGDKVASPLGSYTPGLLIHAELLSGLLDLQAGTAPTPWPGRTLGMLFGLGLAGLAFLSLPRFSAVTNVVLLASAAALWLAVAYATTPHDPSFSIAGPLLAALFLLGVAVPFHWQLAQRKSRQLLGTLRQYVATSVVDELLRRDLKDPLAPRQLEVTTLIADLEGYTSHVEALPVEEAAHLTTAFLDCLTRPVLDKNGTLDKYTGDGLVAFWGAPLPQEEHADLALDAALAILDEVQRFSAAREREGKSRLRVRIGIESGTAMAGDYGSSLRSIYTAVGDSVNTAARLEQAARDYPYDVIIGQGTVARARRHRFLALGERMLRGKEKPVTVYTFDLPAREVA